MTYASIDLLERVAALSERSFDQCRSDIDALKNTVNDLLEIVQQQEDKIHTLEAQISSIKVDVSIRL